MAPQAAAADPGDTCPAGALHAPLRGLAAGRRRPRRRATGEPSSGLVPQSLGHACLGVCLAAYEHWLADDGAELADLLDDVFGSLTQGWAADLG